ncbi:ComF family protein [Clostridium tyrobutyricum]|uniref:ComF family protein n=1 Tax=Clostridium tyrobutyricum TaxID=1519 RepID=UPI001C38A0A7|nr:ComF family protein [Clostridium tyrobutyricum]MBV4418332.1 ComF family protein [Clostridium tyrobutyricum]
MEYGIIESLKFLKDCLLSIVYCGDETCLLCECDLYSDKSICDSCRKSIMVCECKNQLEYQNIKFDFYSASYYSGSIKELIGKLKYKNSFKSGEVIAEYMYDVIKKNNIVFDIITYVPMTKKDEKRRGYNQSKYLASILKGYLKKPVICCIQKKRSTKDQIGLSKEERWNNIKGSFKIVNKEMIKNKNILLVDDVITTGATAFYCALELKNNGSDKVTILTGAKSKV